MHDSRDSPCNVNEDNYSRNKLNRMPLMSGKLSLSRGRRRIYTIYNLCWYHIFSSLSETHSRTKIISQQAISVQQSSSRLGPSDIPPFANFLQRLHKRTQISYVYVREARASMYARSWVLFYIRIRGPSHTKNV